MSRRQSTSRRRVLATLGTGIAAAAAGCLGSNSLGGQPTYEEGTVSGINASNVSNRSATQLSAAAALAQQQPSNSVTPLDSLALRDHEFVVESGYLGSTIQGTVENTGGNRLVVAEVRTRLYDDEGTMLGRYLASTGDLNSGSTWEFQVIVLESPTAVASYDIAVLGTPS
ncbi:FxLYD domain-containing protein [Natrinema sp. HArc-T2]|uniref:FxLYD domain-containing protein n=1 Tax=Natrinema sp. HArc-T2 TaxID=3242701 RepID=UPI00359CC321